MLAAGDEEQQDTPQNSETQRGRWVTTQMNKDALISALSRFVLEANRLLAETHHPGDRQIYEMYLARAGVILARIAHDLGIGNEINQMERLFGNTWLNDGEAYAKAYSTWDEFKRMLTQSIHGMTVNERLWTLGLMEEFERAVERRSEDRLKVVLSKCFLTQGNIRAIIDGQLGAKQ